MAATLLAAASQVQSGMSIRLPPLRCGVPTKQLLYDDIAHSQFVTTWPLLSREQLQADAASSCDMEGLPVYARDLVQILRGT